jgi:hypothetical protein
MFLCLGVLLNLYVHARGLAAPAVGDELYPFVATGAGLPAIVGVAFVLGLIASTWSAAGSALTALTTSFTVDILGGRNADGGFKSAKKGGSRSGSEAHLTRIRETVHIGMAAAMVAVVVAFRALAHTSVIDAVYVLASYTYGPILGMFAFGMASRRQVCDRFVPLVALLSPSLCLLLDLNSTTWFGGYRFGYELLIMNAAFTIIGLMTISIKNTKPQA